MVNTRRWRRGGGGRGKIQWLEMNSFSAISDTACWEWKHRYNCKWWGVFLYLSDIGEDSFMEELLRLTQLHWLNWCHLMPRWFDYFPIISETHTWFSTLSQYLRHNSHSRRSNLLLKGVSLRCVCQNAYSQYIISYLESNKFISTLASSRAV